MKVILLMLIVLLAVAVDLGSSRIFCRNPASFEGKVVCDRAGNFCGQCVSFVKVNL